MRVLIVGAGFGGLELAASLSNAAGDRVEVTLIDRSDAFVFGYGKLQVMFGLQEPAAVRLPYGDLSRPGVTFRQETVRDIDPARKRVVTDRGTYEGDALVVALGADLDPAATPGLVEGGYEFYSVPGAERARGVLERFEGGTVVIAVTTPVYKCPPGPSEAAMLLHDFLTKRGLRERSRVVLVSPLGSPLPVSPDTASALMSAFEQRGIDFLGQSTITEVDPHAREVRIAGRDAIAYDLVLAVPVHVAPKVVRDAGLAENGWIPVDARTLRTRYEGVYAVGDVASAGVPKAGVFAEGQAKAVAADLIAQAGGTAEQAAYQGVGSCYIEFGGGEVGRVDVDFFSGPSPVGRFQAPTPQVAAEKHDFGASRWARWAGR